MTSLCSPRWWWLPEKEVRYFPLRAGFWLLVHASVLTCTHKWVPVASPRVCVQRVGVVRVCGSFPGSRERQNPRERQILRSRSMFPSMMTLHARPFPQTPTTCQVCASWVRSVYPIFPGTYSDFQTRRTDQTHGAVLYSCTCKSLASSARASVHQ